MASVGSALARHLRRRALDWRQFGSLAVRLKCVGAQTLGIDLRMQSLCCASNSGGRLHRSDCLECRSAGQSPSTCHCRDHSIGWIGQAGHADAAGQPTLDGGLDQIGRQEGQRDELGHVTRLQPSRAAMASGPVALPVTISSSHRRPSAIERTSVARVSARIGLVSIRVGLAGAMISRPRLVGARSNGMAIRIG